jgi:hypothetical protein
MKNTYCFSDKTVIKGRCGEGEIDIYTKRKGEFRYLKV